MSTVTGQRQVDLFVNALDDGLTDYRKFTGPISELGNNFVPAALCSKRLVTSRFIVSA
jgi:hypothetical protein